MAIKSSKSGCFKGPKTTPVFLLLDVSGSMYGAKIEQLNDAVETLLQTLAADEKPYLLSVITFGDRVDTVIEPTDVKNAKDQWRAMDAYGKTPLGGALRKAKDLIEDNNVIKGRMYYPIVVVVSDGHPNDDWKKTMDEFISTGRTSKCQRMAMGIGDNSLMMEALKEFVKGMEEEKALFQAHDAASIKDFFKEVTRVSQEQSKGTSSLLKETPDGSAPDSGNGRESEGDKYHGDLPPDSVAASNNDNY